MCIESPGEGPTEVLRDGEEVSDGKDRIEHVIGLPDRLDLLVEDELQQLQVVSDVLEEDSENAGVFLFQKYIDDGESRLLEVVEELVEPCLLLGDVNVLCVFLVLHARLQLW